MRTIDRLKIEARNSANNHGHNMGRFTTTLKEHRVADDMPRRYVAIAFCYDCGCYVQVDTRPMPNGIDIGGNVYSTQCRHKLEEAID